MSYKGPTCWHKISKDVLDCPTVSFQNSCIYHAYLSIDVYLTVIEDFDLTRPKLFNLVNSVIVFLLDLPSKSSTCMFCF